MQTPLTVTYIAYLFLIISLIFFDRKKPELRFSWILLLVLLPVLGLVLYVLLGNALLPVRKTYIRRKRHTLLTRLEKVAEHPDETADPVAPAQRLHAKYGGSPLTEHNEVEIFTSGAAKFSHLFQDIAAAKHYIHVQYFTIQNDPVGQQFLRILAEKSRQGIEVKLLYDTVGCLLTRIGPLLREAKAAGVHVSNIRPLVLDINYRNHRKIVVIDGKIGYTGGMNLGVEYRDGILGKPWRDAHLRITGSAVHQLQKVFLSDWITSVKAPDLALKQELSDYFPAPNPPEGPGHRAQVVANGMYARHENDVIYLGYFNLISRATRRVWVQTPYFVPSEPMLHAFKTLASLGVDVRIMSSSTYAAGGPFHRAIANYFLRYLAASGVKVYRYDGVLHAKTLLIDDDKLCIGTVNLNTRSLERDDELYVFFPSQELAARYEAEVKNDLETSTRFDIELFQKQNLGSRIMESVMSLFSPLS